MHHRTLWNDVVQSLHVSFANAIGTLRGGEGGVGGLNAHDKDLKGSIVPLPPSPLPLKGPYDNEILDPEAKHRATAPTNPQPRAAKLTVLKGSWDFVY